MPRKILSKRGKEKFDYDGYIYTFDTRSARDNSIMFWRCESKNVCKGRIHTRNGEVVKVINQQAPANPENLFDVQIPENYKIYVPLTEAKNSF